MALNHTRGDKGARRQVLKKFCVVENIENEYFGCIKKTARISCDGEKKKKT